LGGDNTIQRRVKQGQVGFWAILLSPIIHDNVCILIHKNSCQNSYHNVIKYHMTLNIIFSIVQLDRTQAYL
jgi:hypothetical protein